MSEAWAGNVFHIDAPINRARSVPQAESHSRYANYERETRESEPLMRGLVTFFCI